MVTNSVRRNLLASTIIAGTLVMSAPAFAQQAPAATPQTPAAEGGETIVVTGSRISSPNLQSTAPVAIVTGEEFAIKGTANIESVLNEMPQFVPNTTAFSNNPGDGSALIDLRGLGAGRNLVLVNGRRYISYDVTQIVDINTIPSALIERVDVLTGGRSAVYGSDAVSGVINFNLKRNFSGVQADVQYALTQKGDGQTLNADLTVGGNFADDRGNATLFFNYIDRNAVFQGARDFSSYTLSEAGDGTTFFGGSGSVPGTRFQLGNRNGTNPAPLVAGNNLFLQDGSTRAYNGATDAYNYAPINYLQLPQERYLIGGMANFEINPHFDVYTELTYVNNRVPTQLAESPVTGNFSVATNNPFISAAVRAALVQVDTTQQTGRATITNSGGFTDAPNDGRVTFSIGRRMVEVGGRKSFQERQAFRALLGVRGEIAGNWRYDAYYSYARTLALESQFGNVSRARFAQALLGCPAGSADGCVPMNIFGPGNISPAAAAFVSVNTKNSTVIVEQVANAAITNNDLFNFGLGADGVGIAVGAEYRSATGDFAPDFVLSSGDVIGFNNQSPTKGSYNTKEVFAEVNVPIIADKPFFYRLGLQGSARYSKYSNNTGGVYTYSASGDWAPVQDIRFRAAYGRAIKGPTINQLYQGGAQNFPAFTDYCRLAVAATNATLRASCISNGVPAAIVGTAFGAGNAQVQAITGGNPNLKAETSDTLTFGAVIQPSFIPRLSFSVDYYNIKIKNAVFRPGATDIRDACFGNAANNYTPYDTSLCALLPRNTVSFDIENLLQVNANAGFLLSRGIDFDLRYNVPLHFGLFGSEDSRLDFRVSATRLIRYQYNAIAAIPDLIVDCTGKFGGSCGNPYSKWRGSASVGLTTGAITTNLRFNYIGASDDDGTQGTVSVTHLKDRLYTDLSFAADITDQFQMRFGVNNLLNLTPPIIGDLNAEQANTYPSTYDPLGRRFFASLTARF